MRSRSEPVQVLHRDGVPERFHRGGRLYQVRSVLNSWVQTEPWWASGPVADTVASLDREHRWWRVEAATGRGADTGVYDLCADLAAGSWRLVGVVD